jgi:hypothetical protein
MSTRLYLTIAASRCTPTTDPPKKPTASSSATDATVFTRHHPRLVMLGIA